MADRVYKFRQGSSVRGVDAQAAGEELDRIHRRHGVVDAAAVVDESRPETAPLHPAFEWDDKAAAEQHRRWQARQIIRSVEVIIQTDGKPESQQVYVHCPTVNESGLRQTGYQPVEVVVTRPDLYAASISEAARKVSEAESSLEKLKRAAESSPESDRQKLAKITVAIQTAQALSAAVQALH